MHTQGYVADVGEALDSALVLLAPRIHGLGQSSPANCALVCSPAFIAASGRARLDQNINMCNGKHPH